MTSFIYVPVKKGYDVDLVKPLNKLIATYYSSSDNQVDVSQSIEELNRLRASCISKTIDYKHESALELYQKYYDSISYLESKYPPSEIQIPFKWKDAFEKSSPLFSFLGTSPIPKLQFEKISVLFNIGAIASQIAASQSSENLQNDHAMKQNAKYFQLASGVFQALQHLVSSLGSDLTQDFNQNLLHFLHNIMLAQAQEIFYHKASNDKMNPSLLAKISRQCASLYSDSIQSSYSVKPPVDREWITLLQMKASLFSGIAEFNQALVCEQQKLFGEQIARLEKALEFYREAESKGVHVDFVKAYSSKAGFNLTQVKKDNDFIYHARIPEHKTLEPIGQAAIAKPTPLPEHFLENPDPFAQLMPLAVQQAVHKLDIRKQDLVSTELNNIRELQHLLNGVLASLNLPASLEDKQGRDLPQSLREKAATIRAKGGIQYIEERLTELPSLMQRNNEIFEETERQILMEEDSDSKLRDKFGAKWNRAKSEDLNKSWKDQLQKFRKLIDDGARADETVQEKFSKHRRNISLLSEDDASLINELPEASGVSSKSQNSQPAIELRKLMGEVTSLQNQMKSIETQLSSPASTIFDDMKTKFLDALASKGHIDEEALSVEALGGTYAPIQKQIRDIRTQQEELIEKIRTTNEKFVELKFGGAGEDRREKFLGELATAHDMFMEITKNLDEGAKFYADITKLLVNLQSKVNDYCFARRAEKDELIKELVGDTIRDSDSLADSKPSSITPRVPPPESASTAAAGAASSSAPTAPNSQPLYHPAASTTYPPQPQQQPPPPQAANYSQLPYPSNPYQQYYYPPPPLPAHPNPYAQPPPPNPMFANPYANPYQGYMPQQQPPTGYPYPNYAYPHQQPPQQPPK